MIGLREARWALAGSVLVYASALALMTASIAPELMFLVTLAAMAAMVLASLACIILQIAAWTRRRRGQAEDQRRL